MKRENLHNYQTKAVRFIEQTPHCALFLSMGLGKSVITLTAISDLMSTLDVERVLVIAPKTVAEATWAQEVEKWDHLRWMRTSIVLGDARTRNKALARDAEIYVTSRDLFVWVTEQYTGSRGQMLKTRRWPFDMVVIDELTSFKSSDSKRFKAFKRLRPYMPRVVGLTGTPTPNGLKDLWGQMYCIDMGASLGVRKSLYLEQFFYIYRVNNIPVRMTLKAGAVEAVTKMISERVLTMKASDYLELPPMIERTMRIPWPEDLREQYERFEEECVLEFDEEASPAIVASNAAVLAGKLLQFCNGAIYTEDKAVRLIHDVKLKATLSLIESAYEEGESVLIFYEFQHDCDRIEKGVKEIGANLRRYKSEKDLRDWNEGKIDVLLTHPASTAYGLNLQKGGHIIIWYGTGWNAELYLQGNARLCRQGQTKPTIVYRVVMAGSMDENALRAVTGKVDGQNAVVEALKELKRKKG